jgi:hypothetical protein
MIVSLAMINRSPIKSDRSHHIINEIIIMHLKLYYSLKCKTNFLVTHFRMHLLVSAPLVYPVSLSNLFDVPYLSKNGRLDRPLASRHQGALVHVVP